MTRFTREKIFHFAGQSTGFNIELEEWRKGVSTASEIVSRALKAKYMVQVASDDCAVYFQLTKKGKIEDLLYKLRYAKKKGRDDGTVEYLEDLIKELREELENE